MLNDSLPGEPAHKPVLLNEVIELLNIKPNGRYVDGTLGLGGHSEAILKKLNSDGRLLGLDVDGGNLRQAKSRLQLLEDQTITRQVNFRGLQGVLHELGWTGVDGMLFDLGVSSPHFDVAERGFSFQYEGPLDMRLDPSRGETALSLLKQAQEEDLIKLLNQFGEYRHVSRFVHALLLDVAHGRITNTKQLADLCLRIFRRRGKSHPATRVFLALRCWVNQELEALEELLRVAPPLLNPGGRLAIISFHSLEDRLVKESFRTWGPRYDETRLYSMVTKKPVVPTDEEMKTNPRARSAKLRVLERVNHGSSESPLL